MKTVVLKKGKERLIQINRHPWIFSGAIESFSQDMETGDLAFIRTFEGAFLGQGYFHLENSLSGRVLCFDSRPISEVIREKVRKALLLRTSLLDLSCTNCFRLINAEEDGLPGLIVDCYDKILVLQINTWGMEKLRPLIVESLIQEVAPSSIYEKSTSRARLQEGLFEEEGFLYGEEISECVVKENGISFVVSITGGQKTGFFLDQREMRKKIGELSKGKNLLNCFSYSGGFSLYGLKGGAQHVTSVDVCSKAIGLCRKNHEISGFPSSSHEMITEDVFTFLEEADLSKYDLIILDPPAFAKKRQEVEQALFGYKKINQLVFERCKPGTLLLTCSCSYFITPDLFQQMLFQAAGIAQKEVKILTRQIQSLDHPISIYHPEGDYLKSLLLWIE
jgi:23S rRNA (cytosine1962-C5)-methyltransferase